MTSKVPSTSDTQIQGDGNVDQVLVTISMYEIVGLYCTHTWNDYVSIKVFT